MAFRGKAVYRPYLAGACRDYADTLLQRNKPAYQEKSTYNIGLFH